MEKSKSLFFCQYGMAFGEIIGVLFWPSPGMEHLLVRICLMII